MKILFVSSGNSDFFKISPFIKAQGESLREKGIELAYFSIMGKGARNYYRNIRPLREHLRENSYDLIHAHYSLCGWVAILASGKIPVVLSLMGDDAQGTFNGNNSIDVKSRFLILLTLMIQPFVRAVISKSKNLEKVVYRKKESYLIPNGVMLSQFKIFKGGCREELGLEKEKKYVLFLGDPSDPNKNFALAGAAVQLLKRPDVALINVYKTSHDKVVKYLNSVDAFVLCSFGEGSPNVVKEAMSCNCPMVTTDVGDAAWIVGETQGCYVASFDPRDFAEKLASAIDYSETKGRTPGRARIIELGLDAESIAERIKEVYQNIID